MHTRVLTFTGAKNIDDGVAFIRDNAVPVLQEQKGYGGVTASADRGGGVLGILSLWETEADRDASFGPLAELRQEGLDVVGGELTVETFEELVVEMASPPPVGSALMVTRISMDPSKVDENHAAGLTHVLFIDDVETKGPRYMQNLKEGGTALLAALHRAASATRRQRNCSARATMMPLGPRR
jgi:hypothetical protein